MRGACSPHEVLVFTAPNHAVGRIGQTEEQQQIGQNRDTGFLTQGGLWLTGPLKESRNVRRLIAQGRLTAIIEGNLTG